MRNYDAKFPFFYIAELTAEEPIAIKAAFLAALFSPSFYLLIPSKLGISLHLLFNSSKKNPLLHSVHLTEVN